MAARTDLEQLVYQMSADITQLTKANKAALASVKDGTAAIQSHLDQAGKGLWSKFLGGAPDVDKALTNVFNATRFKVLDSGIARLGLFGGALEALGPYGLAAAAGVGAFFLTFEGAKEAAEWAENLEQAAHKLGVTLGQLQALQFAGATFGLNPEQLTSDLLKLNEVLGSLQEGEPRALKLLQEAGFTQPQIESFKTVDDLLPALAAKITAAGSAAEQARLAERFGVEDLLPVLKEGPQGLQELTDKFHSLGIEIDDSVVQKAAEAKKAMNEAAAVMQGSLRQAFIDLAPVMATLENGLARLIRGWSALFALANSVSLTNKIKAAGDDLETAEVAYREARSPEEKAAARKNVLAASSALNKLTSPAPAEPSPAAHQNIPGKPGPPPTTDAFDKAAADAIDSANRDYLTALAALTEDIDAHAAFEKQSIDAGLAKQLADLDAEAAKIKAAKNDADKETQLAEIDDAKSQRALEALAKKELIDRTAGQLLDAAALQRAQTIGELEGRVLTARASIADTAKQRADLELQAFKEEQQRVYDAKKLQLDTDVANSKITRPDADAELDKTRAAQDAELIAKRQQELLSANPLAAYSQSLKDVNTDLQNVEVQGLQGLTQGIDDVLTGVKSIGDVFHDVSLSIISDLLKIGIQKEITAPLANLLFGGGGFGNIANVGGSVAAAGVGADLTGLLGLFADGGKVSGPGTGTSDSILARLSNGEFVVNAKAAAMNMDALHAINSGVRFAAGGPVGRGGASGGYSAGGAGITFDMRGAVVTQDLLDQMQRIADVGDNVTLVRAASLGSANAISQIKRLTRNTLGR